MLPLPSYYNNSIWSIRWLSTRYVVYNIIDVLQAVHDVLQYLFSYYKIINNRVILERNHSQWHNTRFRDVISIIPISSCNRNES